MFIVTFWNLFRSFSVVSWFIFKCSVILHSKLVKHWWIAWHGGNYTNTYSCLLRGHLAGAPNVNFRKISVRKTIWDLEFSGAFFLAEMFEKVSFNPYNFRINRLSANVNFRKISVRKTIWDLEFSGAFFLAEMFEKVSFNPYNFRINRLSANVNFRKISVRKTIWDLEFSGAFFLAEMFEKVSFNPYNFRITRLSAGKSEQMKNFQGIKILLYLLFKY